MFNHVTLRWLLCWIALASIVQISCSSPPEESANCEVISDTVSASSWVLQNTGVARYRYSGGPADNELKVELLDVDSKILAEVAVSQIIAGDQDVGAMTASLSRDGEVALTLVSRGSVDPLGHNVQTTLSNNSLSVEVRTRFENTSCQVDSNQDRALCAEPVPVEQTVYSVPSCGLVWETARAYGESPALRKLSYSIPVGAKVPSLGGISTTHGTFTLDILENSTLLPAKDVETWLVETGADEIIGSRDEELLSAFFTDNAWSKAFDQQLASCDAIDGTRQSKLETCAASAGATITRGQAVSSCASAGNRDDDAWGLSGLVAKFVGAISEGDPHLTSFDGYSFDFQGVGEYVLAESTNDIPFTVQGRMTTRDSSLPICQSVSVNSAIAFKIGERRIAIYADRESPLWVDGAPVEVTPSMQIDLPEGASFEASRSRFEFVWPDGETVVFTTGSFPGIKIVLPPARYGSVYGLFGNFNGDINDEFKVRNGASLDAPLSFEAMYRQFGDSWRVAQHESLFDYKANQNTDNFTDLNFPDGPVDVAEIPEDIRGRAVTACKGQGISDPWLFDACVLDFACSSDALGGTPTMGNVAPPKTHAQTAEVSLKLDGQLRLSRPTKSFSPEDVKLDGYCPTDLLDTVWIFEESRKVLLEDALPVDAEASGTYDTQSFTQTTLATSIEVFSYLIHFDQNGRDTLVPATGSVRFSSEILGVIATSEKLAATDQTLGRKNTQFPTDADRGADGGEDSFEISADRKTLSLEFRGAQNIDQLRVVVAAPQGEIE